MLRRTFIKQPPSQFERPYVQRQAHLEEVAEQITARIMNSRVVLIIIYGGKTGDGTDHHRDGRRPGL